MLHSFRFPRTDRGHSEFNEEGKVKHGSKRHIPVKDDHHRGTDGTDREEQNPHK